MRNLGLALTPLSVLALAACSPSTSGLGDTGGDDIADTAGTESGSESTSESGTTTTTTTTETGDGDTTTTTTTTETGTDTTTTTTETGTESTTTTTETGMDTTTTTTTGDGDTTTTTTDTDTGGMPACSDGELGVEIDLTSANLPPEDCTESKFEGWVTQVNGNEFVFDDCACNDEGCMSPEVYTLTLIQPEAGWVPGLMEGKCYEWDFRTQLIAPDACRYSRLDIMDPAGSNKPIYSTGVTNEDFDDNGFNIDPVDPVACLDDCGNWELRDVSFSVGGTTETIASGTSGPVLSNNDEYDAAAWHSWTVDTPACAVEDDVTAWTAIRTGP